MGGILGDDPRPFLLSAERFCSLLSRAYVWPGAHPAAYIPPSAPDLSRDPHQDCHPEPDSHFLHIWGSSKLSEPPQRGHAKKDAEFWQYPSGAGPRLLTSSTHLPKFVPETTKESSEGSGWSICPMTTACPWPNRSQQRSSWWENIHRASCRRGELQYLFHLGEKN